MLARLALAALLLGPTLSGCCSPRAPDPFVVSTLREEIASLGSSSKLEGPRDDAERARLDRQVLKAQALADDLAAPR